MTNLQRFEQNGLELVINTETGESFASVSGYARMSGKNKSTISRRLESVADFLVNKAEMETAQGKRELLLISEDLITTWLPKDNPEMATKMMKAGVRVFLHTLAGFEVNSTAVQPEVKPKTALELARDYLELAKEQVKLLEHLEQLKAEKEANAPLVQYAQAVQFSDDCVDFNTYAKMIGNIGRNKLMQRCRDAHVLMQNSTLPYQRWIDAGYFEVSQEINMSNGKLIPFTLITGKGQIWLKQKLDNHENLTRNAVNAIAQGVLAFGGF
jgi:phage antirepressor YoqD-like protein